MEAGNLGEGESQGQRPVVASLRVVSLAACGEYEIKRVQLDYRAAAEHFKPAADLVPASAPLVRASYLNRAGVAAHGAGGYAAAEGPQEEALRLWQAALGPDDPEVAGGLNNLGALYLSTDRCAEAAPLFQRAIAIGEKTLGPKHPDLASRLNNLALVYHATGRYAAAEPPSSGR